MNNENVESNGPEKGLEQVGASFNNWGSILTTHSLQASYAIIAANWAVHGSANVVINNFLSRCSLTTVFLFLGGNLLVTRLMIRLLYRQHIHAESDRERWKEEYEESRKKATPWPYTKGIEELGKVHRELKLWAPIVATLFFLGSLFS